MRCGHACTQTHTLTDIQTHATHTKKYAHTLTHTLTHTPSQAMRAIEDLGISCRVCPFEADQEVEARTHTGNTHTHTLTHTGVGAGVGGGGRGGLT